ncbi:acetyl-CoA synthetase-like protein, partial [Aureobasidium melanogenum]
MYTTVSSWIRARHESIEKWTKIPVEKEEDHLVITALESLLNNQVSGSATAKKINDIYLRSLVSGHRTSVSFVWGVFADASRWFGASHTQQLVDLIVAIKQLPDVVDKAGHVVTNGGRVIWRELHDFGWIFFEHGLDLDLDTEGSTYAEWHVQAPGHLNSHTLAATSMQREKSSKVARTYQNSTDTAKTKTGCLRWTYRQFNSVSISLAERLSQDISRPGSRIVTLIPNSVEWLLLLSASIISKNAIACLDANMLNKPRHDELGRKIIDLQPSVIVVENAEGMSAAEQALESLDLQDLVKVSLSDKSIFSHSGSWLRFADLCSPVTDQVASARIDDARQDDPDRDALIVYTSGTSSGIPKGCIRHVRDLATYTVQQAWNLPGDTGGKRALQTANFRVIAPGCALKAWYGGATIILTGRIFDPVKFLDAMEEERMTEVVLLPAQLYAIAATPGFELRDKSSLRFMMSGGDIIFTWPYWDGIESIPFYSGIAPLGRPSPGSRVRLIGEDNKTVERGEFGELHIQSDSVFKSYLAAPDKMDVVYMDQDGRWFKTGDLGMINDAGDVYITAVVGRPHPTLGQEPFAILRSFNEKSKSDLSAHVIAMHGPDWVLGGAIELKTLGLETFPTNATGKIQKLDLLAALAGSSAFAS